MSDIFMFLIILLSNVSDSEPEPNFQSNHDSYDLGFSNPSSSAASRYKTYSVCLSKYDTGGKPTFLSMDTGLVVSGGDGNLFHP